ncbi:MAG: CBS domain-containing protein, partial [Candidatus Aenigmarchaeota archaeon]|nr:CBS domain-containing protein [Candidatus Aenigmarchaeota archaeon]MDI6722074.1 CBS domain-containing protein [Candidatus Aenigmarchaeota archaeon]
MARASGVSQSLIAKIESCKINPSYDVTKKIFLALEFHERGREKIAKEIMTCRLIFVKKNDTLREAARIMKKYSISQLPVIENGTIIGSVSEKTIIDNIENTDNMKIHDTMEEPFPII